MTYTAGSLFSGIGGIDLAFAAAGFDVRWQVEIDPYCQKVLRKHAPNYWPNAKLHEDVKHVGREQLETVDVMFGGFPCQDISVAGKRAGLAEGTRSGLWFEFVRIIGELRPRIVVLENVANINVLGGTTVIGDLAEIGYDALWFSLRASDAGAPHRRERWFCVAYAQRGGGHERRRKRERCQPVLERREATERCNCTTKIEGCGKGEQLADAQHIRRDSTPVERGNGETVCDSAQGADGSSKFARVYTPPPLAYAGGARVQGRSQAGNVGRKGSRSNQYATRRNQARRRLARATQSRLGGDLARLSDWMDFPGWPAGPGHEQHDYEPPRVVTGAKNRTPRIKALGNAVVPQVVLPIAVAVRAFLEAQDAAPARSVESEAA